MTIFGILWAVSMLCGLVSRNIKTMLFLTIFYMTFQCANVLLIHDETGIGPPALTSICFLVKSTWHSLIAGRGGRRRRGGAFDMQTLTLYLLLGVVLVSSWLNESYRERFLRIAQLLIYAATFLHIRQCAKHLSQGEAYRIVRAVCVFVLVVGWIQLIVTAGHLPRLPLKILLYNDDSLNVYYNHLTPGHSRRMYSTFMEPSYMAGFMVGAICFFCCFPKKLPENIWLFAGLFLSVIFSFSSTAYVALVLAGVTLLLTSREIRTDMKLVFVLFNVVFGVFFLVCFFPVLNAVIFEKMSSGSAITRAGFNRRALRAFLSSPLYGVGYKNTRGSSIFLGILGELGVTGLASFLLFNLSSFGQSIFRFRGRRRSSEGYYGAMYAVFAVFLCLLIACPDLDLCTYWLWLYVLAVYEGMRDAVSWKRVRLTRLLEI